VSTAVIDLKTFLVLIVFITHKGSRHDIRVLPNPCLPVRNRCITLLKMLPRRQPIHNPRTYRQPASSQSTQELIAHGITASPPVSVSSLDSRLVHHPRSFLVVFVVPVARPSSLPLLAIRSSIARSFLFLLPRAFLRAEGMERSDPETCRNLSSRWPSLRTWLQIGSCDAPARESGPRPRPSRHQTIRVVRPVCRTLLLLAVVGTE
jgi:hypothetical protein